MSNFPSPKAFNFEGMFPGLQRRRLVGGWEIEIFCLPVGEEVGMGGAGGMGVSEKYEKSLFAKNMIQIIILIEVVVGAAGSRVGRFSFCVPN